MLLVFNCEVAYTFLVARAIWAQGLAANSEQILADAAVA